MMPAQHPSRSANSPAAAWSLFRKAGLIGSLAAGFFALGLGDEPFVDEYAYITQSYQPDLLYSGRTNDPAWLEFLGYDLVPLPKYLINLSLRLARIPRPGRSSALLWYANTSYRWGTARELITARLPSIFVGGIGCAAIFALGVLIRDERTGWIAAVLLAINPLYRLHAHRAMSEAPCEALILLSLASGLWAWRETLARPGGSRAWMMLIPAGCLAGLSILAKFTGILALIVLAGWTGLAILLPGGGRARRLGLIAGTALAYLAAGFIFVLFNPFMTAHPNGPLPAKLKATAELGTWQRFLFLVEHRRQVSRSQQQSFSHNALYTLSERAKVVAVQGFGRFGPYGPSKSDSLLRYDLPQDAGAICWLPLVLAGLIASVGLGWRQFRRQEPPLAWALVAWACLAVAVVTAYLPMAWDRYQLPIQAPACLLAAVALASAWDALATRSIPVETRA
jgi:4-amino-4-deoxy-L-arabinose transferase-like glycosyltransferase